MTPYRGFLVWLIGIVLVLGIFLYFVSEGWGKDPNKCINETPNGCFCEEYDLAKVKSGAPGVRQPVNTWSNLYSIATSLFVAFFVWSDRKKLGSGTPQNLMRSNTLMPDTYIFAVLFLGLGSMWFHASITEWGSVFDGLSMYVYASFLVWYSWRRVWNCSIMFWVGYPVTILVFTLMHNRIPSEALIGILVGLYLIAEVTIWIKTGKVMQGKDFTKVLWISAVVAIGMATFFNYFTHGGLLCWPKSAFQPTDCCGTRSRA